MRKGHVIYRITLKIILFAKSKTCESHNMKMKFLKTKQTKKTNNRFSLRAIQNAAHSCKKTVAGTEAPEDEVKE